MVGLLPYWNELVNQGAEESSHDSEAVCDLEKGRKQSIFSEVLVSMGGVDCLSSRLVTG